MRGVLFNEPIERFGPVDFPSPRPSPAVRGGIIVRWFDTVNDHRCWSVQRTKRDAVSNLQFRRQLTTYPLGSGWFRER
ncbi:MAG TPA: hypothetical protein VGV18_05225, partial [Verrucomicrobiae bacterium]|nr:hypothetical protein [Verrucomicrobiae bacterium]